MRPRSASARSSGKWIAAALAVAVHVAFVIVLIFSVNWQNRKPEPVTAELYAPPAPAAAPAKVQPTPPPAAPPKPQPEPPKAQPELPKPPPLPPKTTPRPEPKAEPPAPSKADIALKEKQAQERKRKEQAERERKEAEKRDSEKKLQEQKRLTEARERQAREADALKAQAERERLAQQQATADAAQAKADAARAKADADYIRRIQAKIKGNVVLPPDIAGNPEAIFEVVQLPTGEIIDVQRRKSSGVRAYDESLQRAIIKSSPLPRPDAPDLFRRSLTLKFRPLD